MDTSSGNTHINQNQQKTMSQGQLFNFENFNQNPQNFYDQYNPVEFDPNNYPYYDNDNFQTFEESDENYCFNNNYDGNYYNLQNNEIPHISDQLSHTELTTILENASDNENTNFHKDEIHKEIT